MSLPPLHELSSHGGNFHSYLEAVFEIYSEEKNRFARFLWDELPISFKRNPLVDGKDYTFYHLTHDGEIESERTPNLRRIERIRWPFFILKNYRSLPTVIVWENERKSSRRCLLYHEEERYLIVLELRPTYVLLWTAYVVDNDHTHRKLLREYEAYKKAGGAR